MTTPTERAAAERALAAWRAKEDAKSGGRRPGAAGRPSSRPAHPPGFSEEEAAELGVEIHPLVVPHAEGPDGERFDEIDLLDAATYTDLQAADVPLLVIAMLAEDNQRARENAGDFTPAEALAQCADERGRVVAYPKSYPLAEAWMLSFGGRPWRSLFSAVTHSSSVAAETKQIVADGGAVAYDESKTGARLVKLIDAWWMKNA